MAQGVISRDLNFTTVVGAVSATADSGASSRSLQYDDDTRGLTVHIVGDDAGIGGGAQFDDGDTIDTDSQGTLIIGATGVSGTARAIRVDDDGAVHIADGGNTITVDGTVTANLSTTDNAVLDTIASPVSTISSTPLQRVAIFDASDSQITSFGGGTQYTEGDTDTTITGTALMWEDTGNTLATVTAANPLPVDGSGVTQPVSGTVTANLSATDNAVLDTISSPVATISSTPLQRIAIFDDSDTQITSFGGGTQYTEGATDTTITGTALMIETNTTTSTLGVVSAANPIPVSTVGGNLTVEGTITANAGSGTFTVDNSELPAAAALSSSISNPTTTMIGSALMLYNGSTWERALAGQGDTSSSAMLVTEPMLYNGSTYDRFRGDATNGLTVNLGSNNDVLPSANASTTGLDTVFDSDGDNTAQQAKASAGNLYFIEVSNSNTADAYIQLFDAATGSVTVGTTTPKQTYLVPAASGSNRGAMDKTFTIPITFSTAITYACTTSATGSGDPSAGLIVNIGYK
jgi:hypothetical protein